MKAQDSLSLHGTVGKPAAARWRREVSKTGASRVVLRTRAVPMVLGSQFES